MANGVLRAFRISSRTIRISETDLQSYLDAQANKSLVVDVEDGKGTGDYYGE